MGIDRHELITRLVAGSPLSRSELGALGTSATRAEIGGAIAMLLHRHGHFPLDGEQRGELRLVVAPTGIRVVSRRMEGQGGERVVSLEAAVDHYIDKELGPSCRGVRIVRRP